MSAGSIVPCNPVQKIKPSSRFTLVYQSQITLLEGTEVWLRNHEELSQDKVLSPFAIVHSGNRTGDPYFRSKVHNSTKFFSAIQSY